MSLNSSFFNLNTLLLKSENVSSAILLPALPRNCRTLVSLFTSSTNNSGRARLVDHHLGRYLYFGRSLAFDRPLFWSFDHVLGRPRVFLYIKD